MKPMDISDAQVLREKHTDDRGIRRLGFVIVLLVFGVFGAWAVFAPLAGAVLASGSVTVEFYRKPVQHLEGGIVRSVAVRNNDLVTAGQTLVVMDDTQVRAQLEALRGQQIIDLAREARLIAQRDGLPRVRYPVGLSSRSKDPRVQDAIRVQDQTFAVRQASHEGEIAVYRKQIDQLRSRIDGLRAQKRSRDELVESYSREVRDFQRLLKEGFTEVQRVRDLERNLSQNEGQLGDLVSSIAATELQMAEIELKILQLRKDLQREVAKELVDTQTELFTLDERIRGLEDTLRRTVVTAPESGRVLGMAVHTAGAVVPPGGRLMEIVPQGERLLIEAMVSPADIDRVQVGQPAEVRFAALKSRDLPRIDGKLISISADRLTEEKREDAQSYFLARVEVDAKDAAMLARHGLPLQPGLPADILINTGERTFLQYTIRPLREAFKRGLRED